MGDIIGIDVSGWQPKIDWPRVAHAGIRFAFIKATEDEGYSSPVFAAQAKGALAVKLDVGAYHFAVPEPGDSAELEADRLVNAHLGYGFTLRPVLDFERVVPAMSAKQLIAWADRFVDRVEGALGFAPIFYTYASFLVERRKAFLASKLGRCPLWLAKYSTVAPKDCRPFAGAACWQYSPAGKVDGIPGRVDMNRLGAAGIAPLRVP